jgi:YVTN family beta-propeller protein
MRPIARLAISALGIVLAAIGPALAEDPLALEAKIPLGDVGGRIDHMAFDVAHGRLFVAELGNDSVGVIDVAARTVVHRIAGLKNPQGVGYVPSLDLLLVANASDGSVRLFRGPDYAAAGRIDLGDDADNIRVDAEANRVYVGYGGGALALIDPVAARKVADIPLPAHPESFQLDRKRHRIYVNLPDARAIAVADPAGKQVTRWPMNIGSANFPMTLRDDAEQVIAVFRRPARLGVFAMADGAQIAAPESCGDSDDVFHDAKRRRVYVSCGEGFVDVFDDEGYRRVAHIRTVAGARTALFVPEIDRLLLAVRANGREPAAIWVFRP